MQLHTYMYIHWFHNTVTMDNDNVGSCLATEIFNWENYRLHGGGGLSQDKQMMSESNRPKMIICPYLGDCMRPDSGMYVAYTSYVTRLFHQIKIDTL